MILTFPMDDTSMGCIAWGKITMGRGSALSGVSPIKRTVFGTGTERLTFIMNVNARKTNEPGSKNGMIFESAHVMFFAKEDNPAARKLADVIRKLRLSDPVLVFGKYVPPKDEPGKYDFILHGIEAFSVIPLAWTYDILNGLFDQIVAQTEAPRPPKYRNEPKATKPRRELSTPKQKEEEIPQITHPVVMEDWFE